MGNKNKELLSWITVCGILEVGFIIMLVFGIITIKNISYILCDEYKSKVELYTEDNMVEFIKLKEKRDDYCKQSRKTEATGVILTVFGSLFLLFTSITLIWFIYGLVKEIIDSSQNEK